MAGRTDLGSNSNGNFTPYWVNDGSTISMQPLNSANDDEQPYYVQPFTTGEPVINEPYPYEVSGKTVLMGARGRRWQAPWPAGVSFKNLAG